MLRIARHPAGFATEGPIASHIPMQDAARPFPRKRITAIINPVAGRSSAGTLLRAVAAELRAEGAVLDVRYTTAAGHATELAHGQKGVADALLVVGGDGTICEAANAVCGTDLPIAVIGTGTENLFARQMGAGRDVRSIVGVLRFGVPTLCDVGRVNGRVFLVVVGVGFDAECVARMEAVRAGHITHGDYFWPIWRTFSEHRFPLLRIEVDGTKVFEDRGLAIIGGLPRYAVGLQVLPRARMNDGMLDLCAFPCRSRLELLGHALNVVRRMHLAAPGVVYRQCRRIRLTSDRPVPIEADGDLAGTLPAEITIEPAALRVLAGPEPATRRCLKQARSGVLTES